MDGRRIRCPRHGFSRLVRVRISSGMRVLAGVVEPLICSNVIHYYLALMRERLSNDDRVGGGRKRSSRHRFPRPLWLSMPPGALQSNGAVEILICSDVIHYYLALLREGGELPPSRWVLVRKDVHDTRV